MPVHQAVRARHWDSDHFRLSEHQAQPETTKVVFGNSILTGFVLKLSFHLPS